MHFFSRIAGVAAIGLIGLSSLSGVTVSPDRSRLSPSLTRSIDEAAPDSTGLSGFLAAFREPPTRTLLISIAEETGIDERLAALGADTRRLHAGLHVGKVPVEAIRYISNWPSVKYIEPSRRVRRMLDTSRPAILADIVHDGTGAGLSGTPFTGKNVLVGVLDTGLYGPHPDFHDNGAPALSRVQAFMGAFGAASAATDIDGHGTHVAGIAAGNGFSSGGSYTGIAPGSRLLVYQTSFETTDILSGVGQILSSAGSAPVSINLSLGLMEGPHDGSSLFESAVNSLATGTPGSRRVISVAAGNENGMREHFRATIPALGGTASLGVLVPSPPTGAIDLWADGSPDPLRQAEHDEYQVAVTGPAVSLIVPSGTTASTPSGNLTVSNRVDTSVPNGATHISILPSNSLSGQSISIVLTRTRAGGNGVVDGYIDAFDSTEGFFPSTASGTIIEPANGDNVLSIGAFNSKVSNIGGLSSFSSLGPTRDNRVKPDIAAPGYLIRSARSFDAGALEIVATNDNYAIMSGTSMSTPHVTGIAALAWESNPSLSGAQMRARLRSTAIGVGTVPNNSFGFGKADALEAVVGTVAAISAQARVPTGSPVTLGSSDSSGSFGAPLTFSWALASRPSGSSATLSGSTPSSSFIPDVPGDYVVSLTASQSTPAGIQPATVLRTIRANRLPSTPIIAGPASAATNDPAIFSASSTDPEGTQLTWNWLLVSRPSGSQAVISGAGNSATLVPDISGSYLVGVRAGDGVDNSILAVHAYASGGTASPPPPPPSGGGGGCGALPPEGDADSGDTGALVVAALILVQYSKRFRSIAS